MNTKSVAVVALTVLATSPTRAEEPGAGNHVITNPDWVKKPTPETMLSVWPKAAMEKGIDGKAVISCEVSRQGVMKNCVVVSEFPAGAGFGQAAIAMTPQLLLSPMKVDGVPVDGGRVQMPLTFKDSGGSTFGTNPTLTIHRWTTAPTFAQVAAAYPKKARDKKLGGRVVLDCKLAAAGKLGDCIEFAAQPPGLNLGLAAKTLARYFTGPETVEGKSTKGMSTQIIVVFTPEMLNANIPTIGKPDWVALPTARDLAAALPTDNSLTGTARIRLDCAVVVEGRVEDCKIISEDPPAKGLGTKALELVKYFQLTVWSQEGLPTVGGRVTIPIRYELGAAPTSPKP